MVTATFTSRVTFLALGGIVKPTELAVALRADDAIARVPDNRFALVSWGLVFLSPADKPKSEFH
jgi:hypothetical protein